MHDTHASGLLQASQCSQIASVPEAHTYNAFLFSTNVTRACTESVYYKTICFITLQKKSENVSQSRSEVLSGKRMYSSKREDRSFCHS